MFSSTSLISLLSERLQLSIVGLSQPLPHYSNPFAQQTARLNDVCCQTVLPWLQQMFELTHQPEFYVGGSEAKHLWEFVSGMGVQVGDRRLVLVPSDSFDSESFAVPQEWMDVPTWAGDYYLMVQVEEASRSLTVWGFVSHAHLQRAGVYDEVYRTYRIDREQLVADLDLLPLSCQLCGPAQGLLSQIPEPSDRQLQLWLAQLSQPSWFSPRLTLSFVEWAGLLNHSVYWQQLYQHRLAAVATQDLAQEMVQDLTQLGQWLQQSFVGAIAAGWQAVETFLDPTQMQLAYARRAPQDSGVRRAKLLNLQAQLGDGAATMTVVLLVALTPEKDGRTGVLVQIHPHGGVPMLPSGLQLALLDEDGDVLQELTSRDRDLYVQLPLFRCPQGAQFQLRVRLEGHEIIEGFAV